MADQRTTSQAKKQSSSLIINGIHLHSKVDPHKEAEIFCDKYENEIFSNSHHMVLGLGLGYHLNELIKRLYKVESKIDITIIEPNIEMIQNYREEFPQFADIPGVRFYSTSPDNLYMNAEFIDILYRKPAMLIHKSSYDANKEYFYNFLTFKPQKNLASYKEQISLDFLSESTTFQKSEHWGIEEIENLTKHNEYNIESVFWSLYHRI